jgi:hypothetical protein
MNREDIYRMARKARVHPANLDVIYIEGLEEFAILVEEMVREYIAKSLENQANLTADKFDREWALQMADAVKTGSLL